MKNIKRATFLHAAGGLVAGLLNGLLGAGGGMVIVPMLEKTDLPPTRAHATSIAIIMPLCILSAVVYMNIDSINLFDALPYLPAGIVGGLVGAKLLPHIPQRLLRRLFGLFLLYASFRMLRR